MPTFEQLHLVLIELHKIAPEAAQDNDESMKEWLTEPLLTQFVWVG
jgi:hypothetical protein